MNDILKNGALGSDWQFPGVLIILHIIVAVFIKYNKWAIISYSFIYPLLYRLLSCFIWFPLFKAYYHYCAATADIVRARPAPAVLSRIRALPDTIDHWCPFIKQRVYTNIVWTCLKFNCSNRHREASGLPSDHHLTPPTFYSSAEYIQMLFNLR